MIYSSWDIEQNKLKLVILGNFLPFTPPKIKILKNEKICWRYHHFTRVPKIKITWCTFLDMRSETDRIFYHFGPFFALLPPQQSYDVWFPRYGMQQTEFFVILDHFLHFYPTNNLKNQNFEKIKQIPRDIIISHRCTITDNHMMYGSSNIFCHSGPVFALLPP